MQQSSYIKFLLTILVIAVIFFAIVGIQALDRIYQSNQKILAKLEQLSQKEFVTKVDRENYQTLSLDNKAKAVNIANISSFTPNAPIGGRLITSISADPPNLNPLISNEATASSIYSYCSASLAERNWAKPEEFQPLLAESWKISSDYKSYHIKLRKGCYWQSYRCPDTGKIVPEKEITASDFAFLIEVIRDKDVNCAPMRVYYQDLDEIKILNDFEFIISWKKVYYGSLSSTLGMTPLPRHFYQWNGKFSGERFNNDHKRNRMIVSCGPYVFSSWSTERRILLERNKRFFGNKFGVGGRLEYLVFDIIKHPNTRFQALLSGNLDRLGLTPDQWIKRSNEEAFKKNYNRYKYLLPQFTYIGYNQNNPIFKDKRTRQALTMLVDREKIKKDIYHNLAEVITGPFFPKSSYYNNNIKPLPYNPQAAKKLLAQAGWKDIDNDGILEKDGRKFEFTMLQIPNHPIQQKMMPIIKESFAAAGIDMKLQNVEWSVYIQRLENRTYDACSLGWSSSFDPDMYQIWHSSQSRAGGSNHINYSNPQLDKLIIQMRETFDKKKREEIAHKIGEILHEDQPYTFLFCPYSLSAISKRYNDVKLYPIGIPDLPFYVNKNSQLRVPGI